MAGEGLTVAPTSQIPTNQTRFPKTNMKTEPTPFFLFLGDSDSEAATSKLQAAGWRYKKKRLDSSTENWQTIIEIVRKENPVGILAKLTPRTYRIVIDPHYARSVKELFSEMQGRSHVIFIHESLFSGKADLTGTTDAANTDKGMHLATEYFQPPSEEDRKVANCLMEEFGLNAIVYRRNAEMMVMASSFVNQNEKHLIFRIYVPVDRLWAKEAETVLHLFRDYLAKVGGLKVRQDQYSTSQGVIYELFGDHALDQGLLSKELSNFSQFMAMCIENPALASTRLLEKDIDRDRISELVDRFSKEARRLKLDFRQDLERKLLSIKHRMESELVEIAGQQTGPETIQSLIDAVVPPLGGFAGPLELASFVSPVGNAKHVTVNLNPQFISEVNGIVAQEILGNQAFGSEANQLACLVHRYGGRQSADLTSALHEFEDPDSRHENRLSAKQKLLSFLIKAGEKAGDVAFGVLQKYIENKMGT